MRKTVFGRSVIVAIDHGLHWGVHEGFEDPSQTLDLVLEADPDGILASVPFLRRYQNRISSYDVNTIGTIDLLHNSTLPGDHEDAEIHSQVFSTVAAAEVADAAKVALVYGREDPAVLRQNIEFVARAAKTCRDKSIPLIVEPTLWGNRIDNELDPNYLVHANRLAFELGADILKTPYPPEDFDRIISNSPQPVYIAGGPALDSDHEMLEMVRNACDAGALGVMFGRNIWQHDNPAGVIKALSALVHGGSSVSEANSLFE